MNSWEEEEEIAPPTTTRRRSRNTPAYEESEEEEEEENLGGGSNSRNGRCRHCNGGGSSCDCCPCHEEFDEVHCAIEEVHEKVCDIQHNQED